MIMRRKLKKNVAEYSEEEEEDTDQDNMPPEKAYEILDKKYSIAYTDWTDSEDVEKM